MKFLVLVACVVGVASAAALHGAAVVQPQLAGGLVQPQIIHPAGGRSVSYQWNNRLPQGYQIQTAHPTLLNGNAGLYSYGAGHAYGVQPQVLASGHIAQYPQQQLLLNGAYGSYGLGSNLHYGQGALLGGAHPVVG